VCRECTQGFLGKVVVVGTGADARPLNFPAVCPECVRKAEEAEAQEAMRAQMEERSKPDHAPFIRKLQAGGVTEDLFTATLRNYDPSENPDALNAAREFVKMTLGRECSADEQARFRNWLYFWGPTGPGKCLGAGTPVLMYDGTVKPVEQVSVGDLLMGPDSSPREVLATTKGSGDLYRVTPVKGDSYVVNGHHVLSLRMSAGAAFAKAGTVVNVNVQEYFASSRNFRRLAKGWRTGVEFSPKPVLLDPYLLGVWLGDGDSDRPMITTPEPEIIEYLYAFAAKSGITCSTAPCPGAVRIRVGSSGSVANPNPVTQALRSMKLLYNKHVPHTYLANSREVRMQLLAGLLDTDGSLSSAGGYEITIKQPALRDGILFLARSLGLAAYSSVKVVNGAEYHRVSISGECDVLPLLVPRKQASARRQIKSVLVTGIDVRPIGPGDYYGFTLSGDHLFLLGDFTVTHNSHLLTGIARALYVTGYAGKWIIDTAPNLVRQVQGRYGSGEADRMKQTRIDADVWLLDDLGRGKQKDDAVDIINEILHARVGRRTVISSNFHRQGLTQRHNDYETLVSRLGGRYCQSVEVKGKDRREDEE
jgi:hypothetical protein